MGEIPQQIDKRVRRAIAALTRPWRIVKKRDHYFLQVEDQPMICVGNNSSSNKELYIKKALNALRRFK